MTTKKLGRRELLRGGGVAALAVAGVAVVPFAARAQAAPNEDAIVKVWRLFVENEVAFGPLLDAQDAASDDTAVDAAHERHFALRREIAKAAVTGPMALAIKLGIVAHFDTDDAPDDGAGKLYRYAVKQAGGFDPIAQLERALKNARAVA